MYIEGVDVLIDGLVPVVPDPDGAGPPIPAFCHSSDCTWPALVQKGYAKLRGSYQRALGDGPAFILQALTSAPSVIHPLTGDADKNDELWPLLLDAVEKRYVVCACAAEEAGVAAVLLVGAIGP